MNRIFSLLGGMGIIVLSTISCTFAYTQEQQEAYQWAYKYKITTKSSIEAANLNGKITRQAFAKMVVNYLENVVGVKQTTSNSCYFLDEGKITNDLKPYAKKTCAYGIMGSNGKNFNPTQSVDRAQLGTVLSRILRGDEHNSSGKGYYIYHVNALKDAGIMNNISNVSGIPAKRGDVLIMLKRMYDKFGSNIYMNSGSQSSYNINNTASSDNSSFSMNPNVIYTGKDGSKYYYNTGFLNMLRDEANKKGASDLVKYLEIETKYYVNGLDQLESLDMDNLPEMLGIDEDINPETMTKKEKEALLKKIKDGVNNIIKENKDKNDEYLSKLQKVIKNINDDEFGLKEKYKKTKEFMDTTDSFLVLYSEIVFEVMEASLTSEDGEIDDETGIGMVFGLMASALVYQSEAQEYQGYLEKWAKNVTKLLIDGEDSSNIIRDDTSENANRLLRANQRAKDVARKSDLSQIQTAIVTSQQDKGKRPGMNTATKGISVLDIKNELMQAGMSMIPTDPVENNKVSGLGTIETTNGEYSYLVAKRNGVNNGGFVLMANTENEIGSNWVVCKNKSGLSNGYITNDTDLANVHTCTELTKGNSCSANACTYTDEDELRYILIY